MYYDTAAGSRTLTTVPGAQWRGVQSASSISLAHYWEQQMFSLVSQVRVLLQQGAQNNRSNVGES